MALEPRRSRGRQSTMPSVGPERGVVGQSNDIRRSASLPVQTLVDQEVFGNESEETRRLRR